MGSAPAWNLQIID
jgi:hypothetical protein